MSKPPRVGEALIQRGLITSDQLRIALMEQGNRREPLGRILVALGFITEGALRGVLAETLHLSTVDLTSVLPDREAIALLPLETAKRHLVFPVTYNRETRSLQLAMGDVFDIVTLDRIAAQLGTGINIQAVLAGEAEIAHAIDHFYGHELSLDGILREIESGRLGENELISEHAEYSHPMVRLVDAVIADAVRQGASDIHFEPEEHFLRIRFRVDGVLRPVRSLHGSYWSPMSVRLKVMAGLNIAETRAPQDGRIALWRSGRPIDLRVSVLPTLHGENIVLRVLDRKRGILPLDMLGLCDESLATLQFMMARPEGIILITGPTGSGKTTTLYAILGAMNTSQVNIVTLEDPVEYPLTGVRQSSVNDAVKLDFANGIRAVMRQDPDIILVGEIRDRETAEMALRAAMTGHQVYATLHTSSALGAIPRLMDLGLQPELLAGNVIGVVAQRLVRKLCPQCREPSEVGQFERRLLRANAADESLNLWRAKGCAACDQQGYRGRMALIETVRFDEEMDELLAHRATTRDLFRAAAQRGFRTLADEGIAAILEGVTTLEEVSRVVDLTSRLV